MVFVKIEPVTGFFLDYVKEFGHRNRANFQYAPGIAFHGIPGD